MARRSNNGGIGLGVVAIAFLVILGKCGNTNDPAVPSAILDTSIPAASAPSTMYVSSATLNCREAPKPTSPTVTKLTLGDEVSIGSTEDGWGQATRPEGNCWVAQRFLAEERPEPPVEAVSYTPAPRTFRAVSEASDTSGSECGFKRKCGQMDSCSEAMHYLNDCGVGRLDGDGDGVPCESIC